MISFQNRRRYQRMQNIKNMQNTVEQLRLINLARHRKNKPMIDSVSDSASVFDETSSDYDDINSVNGDFSYLTDESVYIKYLDTIFEEDPNITSCIENINKLSNFKQHLIKLEVKYRSVE